MSDWKFLKVNPPGHTTLRAELEAQLAKIYQAVQREQEAEVA